MRRALRTVLWIAVFGACFGIGAYVAAHTDPFPPGVEDPGARPDPDGSPTGPAADDGWVVQIEMRTHHDLYVGGRCAASWRVEVTLDEADLSLSGTGAAALKGQLRCDEPTAQIQADRIELEAVGVLRGGEVRFRLDDTARSPVGAQDLSGLVETLPTLRFRLPQRDGATATFDISVPDGDRGTYGAVGDVLLLAPTT
ncbi:MAG TPA: hypothetical protein VI341_11305 [Actinomycetota bacterium]